MRTGMITSVFLVVFFPHWSWGQIRPTHSDESKVPEYTLPELLRGSKGQIITKPEEWPSHRLDLINRLANEVYGTAPSDAVQISVEKLDDGLLESKIENAVKVRRKQLAVVLKRNGKQQRIDLAIFSPATATAPMPCFLGLNFTGNNTVHSDPALLKPSSWLRKTDAESTAAGSAASRWPVEAIAARGFAVATAYYGDIDPDFDDQFENGIHQLFPDYRCDETNPGRWGTIASWAWGLSRLTDALIQDGTVHPEQIMVIGHSRLGKTALWAGATDPRFRIVYSNNSGCGGAALSMRGFGETVARINQSFPHWFCRNFRKYNDREEALPVDQHMLIAAIAPRPVYIASATEDSWADPKGEYLAGWHASAAYRLLGLKGLDSEKPPQPGTAVGDSVGYHLRQGKHDIVEWDWQRYMDFAEKHRK